MRSNRVLLLLAALLLHGITFSSESNRKVLALYDSTESGNKLPDGNNFHQLLEMPVNRLGLFAEYHDVNVRPLPDASQYRAILIWFSDNKIKAPAEYCRWLAEAIRSGTRAVVIDGLGADYDLEGNPTQDNITRLPLAALGLAYYENAETTLNPFVVKRVIHNKAAFGFETSYPPSKIGYDGLFATAKDVESWLGHKRTDKDMPQDVSVVVCPRGGWVSNADDIVRYYDKPMYRVLWDLNPFMFLEAALGCKGTPRPDVTTAFGRRAAFCHVDGDSPVNMTIDFPGEKDVCANKMYDEILSKYTVPTTIGLIAGWVDTKGFGHEEWMPMWKKIMSLEHVQSGCHGYAHPMNWAEGVVGLGIPWYKYDAELETVGAMEFLNKNVLPQDEPVEVFLWTGDCAPKKSDLKRVREFGVLNLNGGNPRYDSLYNSVSFIAPLMRSLGEERQVYAPAGNEYLYTDKWTQNYGGFRKVIETFERSAKPRLLPVNIYYHFYLADRQAGLASMHDIYEWAVSHRLCWIHAAEYCRSVLDFEKVRIVMEDGYYRVENYGHCRTVRFDSEGGGVDMSDSVNVLGYTHFDGSLYVTLASGESARFKLTDKPPVTPCLRNSTSVLRDVVAGEKSWRASARVYGRLGVLRLQGFSADAEHKVVVDGIPIKLRSNPNGGLDVPLPGGKGQWVEVKVGD